MNFYKRLKQETAEAVEYHKKYDWFLSNFDKFKQREKPFIFDENGKTQCQFYDSKKYKHYDYEISLVDIAYFKAKKFIHYTEKEGAVHISILPDGIIFLTEEKSFLLNAQKKLEEAKYHRNQNRANLFAIWAVILTSIIAIIAILSDEQNLLGRHLRGDDTVKGQCSPLINKSKQTSQSKDTLRGNYYKRLIP